MSRLVRWRFAALSLGLALPMALLGTTGRAQNEAPPLPKRQLNIGIHLIDAEVAQEDATRARGLMFRQQLGASEGMLFVFPNSATQCFWMRNTRIPLSIAFMDARGVVVNLADMRPLDDTSHCSTQPVRYALEMNQGWFAQRGVGPGAVVEGLPQLAHAPQPAPPPVHASPAQAISLRAPWIRASVPGQTNGAGYVVIGHRGQRDDRLLAVRSDAAERVELHTHIMENGMARMRRVEGIALAAGQDTALAPGGYHIMFLNLRAPFKAGEKVAATLQFERAGEVAVEFTVQPATYRPEGGHDHPHGHSHGNGHGTANGHSHDHSHKH